MDSVRMVAIVRTLISTVYANQISGWEITVKQVFVAYTLSSQLHTLHSSNLQRRVLYEWWQLFVSWCQLHMHTWSMGGRSVWNRYSILLYYSTTYTWRQCTDSHMQWRILSEWWYLFISWHKLLMPSGVGRTSMPNRYNMNNVVNWVGITSSSHTVIMQWFLVHYQRD